MSYKRKVDVVEPQEGYDLIYKIYKTFHSELDSWDKGKFKSFLPRDLNGMSILDLGSGDCRVAKNFLNTGIGRYVACDISKNMLSNCGSWVEKKVCDLEENLPFENNEFDIILSFFSILYVDNIKQLFDEAYRVMKEGGRFIVLHHYERKPYEYKYKSNRFKIKSNTYSYNFIEKLAENSLFFVDSQDLFESKNLIGKLYCFSK